MNRGRVCKEKLTNKGQYSTRDKARVNARGGVCYATLRLDVVARNAPAQRAEEI